MLFAWLLAFVVIAPVVFAYFLIIKGTDRYEPEPFWLLSISFFWGAVVATVSAALALAMGTELPLPLYLLLVALTVGAVMLGGWMGARHNAMQP